MRGQTRAGGAGAFELPTGKKRLAGYPGMTPENLSRAIRALRSYGVGVDAMRVTIGDREELERFARPTPLIDDPEY